MEKTKILIVEDDAAINDIVCKRLAKEGIAIEAAFSGTEARRLLEGEHFDVVITDLMLPGLTGRELVKELRESNQHLPTIVISARTAAPDKIDLLSLGADDYLTKPFDLDELVARVKVQLRRSTYAMHPSSSQKNDNLTVGSWTLDPSERSFSVDSTPVSLTRTEFALIEILMRHPRRVFTKQELYGLICNDSYLGQENSVSTHISNLRAKLKATGTDTYIETVWGLGFKLDVK